MDVLAAVLGALVVVGAVRMAVLRGRLHRLQEQVITDPLTGAFNRRHLSASVEAAIERRNRTGEPASLLMFDVDRFKEINDTYGHVAGDEVLKALVALVAGRARKLDLVFRVGGEEFALLLSGARFTDAVVVAEDIRLRVAAGTVLEGRDVSISIGVSELRDGQSAQAWIEDADAALYVAKHAGRNRVAGTRPGGLPIPVADGPRNVRVSVPI